jgi:molybdate transport system substrate-binding protein
MQRWMRMAGVAAIAVVVLGACGSSEESGSSDTAAASPTSSEVESSSALDGEITVMAPMPLNPVLTGAEEAFEAANPGVDVLISYGHVPALLAQLKEGVPGDLLVTPDKNTMSQAADASLLTGSPAPLAESPLALVVPASNPGDVSDVSSLDDEGLTIVTCATELPCGKLAEQLAQKAGLALAVDSQEPGGSPAIVTKAATGEIDLGVVFAVDVKAGGDEVDEISIDEELAVSSQVTGSVLAEARASDIAEAFLAFLVSEEGQELFAEAGFAPL